MAEETTTAVETTETAATQIEEVSPLEAALIAKDIEIAAIAKDRDNYKRGMLKAKGKLKEDDDDSEETVEEKVSRLVKEQLLDARYDQAQQEKEELFKKTLSEMKELKTALKNRSQISTTGAGSGNETKVTPKDNVLSEDKLKQLRGLGWSDAKIELFKKNLMRLK